MCKYILVLFFALLTAATAFSNSAYAGVEVWSTDSGKTVFESAATAACNSSPVLYTTQYENISLKGTVFVHSDKVECQDNLVLVTRDYYEEISEDERYYCKGSLTLNLIRGNPGSYVQWHSVEAVRGRLCPGAGIPIKLPLKYSSP